MHDASNAQVGSCAMLGFGHNGFVSLGNCICRGANLVGPDKLGSPLLQALKSHTTKYRACERQTSMTVYWVDLTWQGWEDFQQCAFACACSRVSPMHAATCLDILQRCDDSNAGLQAVVLIHAVGLTGVVKKRKQ